MFKKTLFSVLALKFLTCSLNAEAAEVSRAKAAELSLHRIERLVVLKKIEPSFLSKLSTLSVAPLNHSVETDPAFKVMVEQTADPGAISKKVEIVLLGDGRPSSQTVLPDGAESTTSPVWPDKDSATLLENALHFVLDNAAAKPDLLPFLDQLSSLSLHPGSLPDLSPGAVVLMTNDQTTETLIVRLKFDGTFDSYAIE